MERTLLSAAFDVDLDFGLNLDFDFDPLESCTDPVQPRGRAALQRRVKRKKKNPASAPHAQPRCLPERSMRIRLMNPHAQSKDPFTPSTGKDPSGNSLHCTRPPPSANPATASQTPAHTNHGSSTR